MSAWLKSRIREWLGVSRRAPAAPPPPASPPSIPLIESVGAGRGRRGAPGLPGRDGADAATSAPIYRLATPGVDGQPAAEPSGTGLFYALDEDGAAATSPDAVETIKLFREGWLHYDAPTFSGAEDMRSAWTQVRPGSVITVSHLTTGDAVAGFRVSGSLVTPLGTGVFSVAAIWSDGAHTLTSGNGYVIHVSGGRTLTDIGDVATGGATGVAPILALVPPPPPKGLTISRAAIPGVAPNEQLASETTYSQIVYDISDKSAPRRYATTISTDDAYTITTGAIGTYTGHALMGYKNETGATNNGGALSPTMIHIPAGTGATDSSGTRDGIARDYIIREVAVPAATPPDGVDIPELIIELDYEAATGNAQEKRIAKNTALHALPQYLRVRLFGTGEHAPSVFISCEVQLANSQPTGSYGAIHGAPRFKDDVAAGETIKMAFYDDSYQHIRFHATHNWEWLGLDTPALLAARIGELPPGTIPSTSVSSSGLAIHDYLTWEGSDSDVTDGLNMFGVELHPGVGYNNDWQIAGRPVNGRWYCPGGWSVVGDDQFIIIECDFWNGGGAAIVSGTNFANLVAGAHTVGTNNVITPPVMASAIEVPVCKGARFFIGRHDITVNGELRHCVRLFFDGIDQATSPQPQGSPAHIKFRRIRFGAVRS